MGQTVVQMFRFCHRCHSLFYEHPQQAGSPSGSCPAGGPHEPMGYQFVLPVHEEVTATAQGDWWSCGTCGAMFFDGYPDKGRCPGADGGHGRTRSSEDFALPHDVPGTASAQTEWRFCNKCHVMFYDGYEAKGTCAAGGGHVAQGYGFVLPHRGS